MIRLPTILLCALALFGCDAPEQSGFDNSKIPADSEVRAMPQANISQDRVASPEADSHIYTDAVRCTALTNIVGLLVESNVIEDPDIVGFAGRAKGIWLDVATVEGVKLGKSASTVQTDIDRQQLYLLEPITTLPEHLAAGRIQSLIRSTGECQT